MNTQEDDSLLYRGGGSRGKLLWYVGIGLFVAWNILLFILAVVAIAKVNNQSSSGGSSYTYAPISRPFTVGANQQVPPQVAVSLQSNGKVRVGGGTSVYTARGARPPIPVNSENIQSTSFNHPFTNEIIPLSSTELVFMAWTNSTGVYGVLGSLSLDPNSLSVWGTPKSIPGLTKTEALIALRNVDSNNNNAQKKSFALAGAGGVVIGIVTNEQLGSLEFVTSAPQPYNGTENTLLARLSGTEFVLAYATVITLPNPTHKMQATVAYVNYDETGNFLSLQLNGQFTYTADRPYHALCALVSAGEKLTNEFVIAYPSSTAILINSTNLPSDILIAIKCTWRSDTKQLAFGPTTSLTGVRPNAIMTAVAMPTATFNPQAKAVIVFVNERENDAVTAVSVTKSTATFAQLDSLEFGSAYTISNSAVDGTFQVKNGKVIPFLSATFVDDQRVAIAYSNLADGAKITTLLLELSPYSLAFSAASPNFVISAPNPNLSSDYWWVKVAPLKFSSQIGYAVWAYLQTGVASSEVIIQSVVEHANPPLGVVVTSNANPVGAGQQVPIVVSGVYKFPGSPFQNNEGRFYYTDTLGRLHVRTAPIQSIDYVITDSDTLVSLNSRVGLAISSNELLLINELS